MTLLPHNTRRRSPHGGWALVCALLVGALLWTTSAIAGPLDDAQATLEEASARTAVLEAERQTLEAEYRALVAEVESHKDDGGDIVTTFELRQSLSKARTRADALNDVASELRKAQTIEQQARKELVVAFDREVAQLEQQLLQASPAEQIAIIGQLEALQVQREDERRQLASDPLEPVSVPDLEGFQSEDPDELMAAADELADTEEQMQRQLAELETRISALEKRKRLYAYAEDTRDQASLFNEDIRSTSVSGTREESGARTSNDSNKTGATNRATGESDVAATSPEQSPGFAAEPDADGMAPPSDPSPPLDSFAGASNDDELRNAEPDSGTGTLAAPPIAPDAPEVATGPSRTGVIRSDADIGVVAGSGATGSKTQVDQELRKLKSHHSKLDATLRDLRAQQKKLRKRASDLGQ